LAEGICREEEPKLTEIGSNSHKVACHKVDMLERGVDIWEQ